jgi:hypothetical protein
LDDAFKGQKIDQCSSSFEWSCMMQRGPKLDQCSLSLESYLTSCKRRIYTYTRKPNRSGDYYNCHWLTRKKRHCLRIFSSPLLPNHRPLLCLQNVTRSILKTNTPVAAFYCLQVFSKIFRLKMYIGLQSLHAKARKTNYQWAWTCLTPNTSLELKLFITTNRRLMHGQSRTKASFHSTT